MTELLSPEDVRSDPELIALVRGGDRDAYGVLYERHVGAAQRLARQLARGSDADDLVSEAFTKVMLLLQGGQGPDVAFRAYVLTAIRRLHVDRVRGEARLTPSEDMTAFDPGIPFQDTAVTQFESGAAARAFASLPERWQLVLWHLEVEGQKPADIAPLLGMSPNSVSALAYRAREGLRQAFLSAHLRETEEDTCRWVTENLGSYVRKGLSRRDSTKIDVHLRECRPCTAMYLELAEVNSNLAGVIAPLLLGSLAAGYLASVPAGSAGGAILLWDRVKDFAGANSGATAVGAAAATVAAVAIATTMMGPADEVSDPIADSPTSQPTSDGATSDARTAPPAQRRGGSPAGTSREPDARLSPPALVPAQAAPPEEPAPAPAFFEPVVDEVVDVLDPDEPTVGPGDPTTLQIASATLDDEALSLTLRGVPSDARDVVVQMSSGSGQVWFAQNGSPCDVGPRETARCPLGTAARVGTIGNSAYSRAVPSLADPTQTLRLPITYPASLEEDTVTVSIRLPGVARDEVLDSLTLTFRPSRPGGGPTTPTSGTTTPTSGTTTPTSGTTTPTSGTTTPTSGSTTPTSGSTTPTTGTTTPTSGSTTPTSGSTTPTSDATTPTSGTTTPTSGSTTPSGTDISLSLSLQGGTGQVRVTVDGLPVAHDRRDLVIELATEGGTVPVVPLDRLCEPAGPTRLVCETTGRVEHTDLRLDTTLLAPGQTVVMTFTASLPGEDDPDPSDNTGRLSITDTGEIGIEGQLGFSKIVVEAAREIESSISTLPSLPIAIQPTERPTTLIAVEKPTRAATPSPVEAAGEPAPSQTRPTAVATSAIPSQDRTQQPASPRPTATRTADAPDPAPRPSVGGDRDGDDAQPATTETKHPETKHPPTKSSNDKANQGKAKGHAKKGKALGTKKADRGTKSRRHGRR